MLGGGCKGKPKRKAPPAAGSAAATGSGSGSGSAAMRPAPDLILPRSADGGPPKKTSKPLEKADFEKLDKLEFPGFTIEHRTVGDKVMEVRQKTKDHPRIWATVTIQPCLACIPMELPKWKEKEQELKVAMGSLKDVPATVPDAKQEKLPVPADPKATYYVVERSGTPDARTIIVRRVEGTATTFVRRENDCTKKTSKTVAEGPTLAALGAKNEQPAALLPGSVEDVLWQNACSATDTPRVESELGATELAGATVIYHYYVGFGTTPGEGGGETTFGNAYIAYYNDGINEIRVFAEYKDDPATIENLKKLASKDDLRAVALSFMDVYTHAW
jgi:hypothetical protein